MAQLTIHSRVLAIPQKLSPLVYFANIHQLHKSGDSVAYWILQPCGVRLKLGRWHILSQVRCGSVRACSISKPGSGRVLTVPAVPPNGVGAL